MKWKRTIRRFSDAGTRCRPILPLLCVLCISFYGIAIFGSSYGKFRPMEGVQLQQKPVTYQGPLAICTFLANKFSGRETDFDDDDEYFVGARVLAYQLLHAPETKLQSPVPVIVLVTEDVRESKRQRLRDDGMTVIEVENIQHSLSIMEPRWVQTFTKLRLFDPTVVPYEKVLYMDTDIVITRPVDVIFRDPSSVAANPINHTEQVFDKDTSLPKDFIMAATPESGRFDHPYPFIDAAQEKSYFNSGLFIYSPTSALFQHYLHILKDHRSWFHGFPDQDLLNHAHRWDGPMPWKRLHPSWYLNWPNDNDMAGGMVALHAKWWKDDLVSPAVKEYAFARRWEMEGYWKGKEGRPVQVQGWWVG